MRSGVADDYELVIEPDSSWMRLPLRDVARHRDLLFLMVRRDFVAKYRQTVLGPAWFVIQPLLMTVVFTVVFGKVAKIPTDGHPKLLFYLCGMLPWSYFSQCLQNTSTTFVSNAALFGKVYFPRVVVPLSKVISNLIAFAIQAVTFLVFWVYFKFFTTAGPGLVLGTSVALLPVLLVQTGLAGLGVGLWMSALTAKYRDFSYLTGFLTQFWFYATPVVYPLSEIPERWRWVWAVNPMSGIVESYRHALLGVGTVRPLYLLLSAGMTVVLVVSGLLAFGRTERTFIDTV